MRSSTRADVGSVMVVAVGIAMGCGGLNCGGQTTDQRSREHGLGGMGTGDGGRVSGSSVGGGSGSSGSAARGGETLSWIDDSPVDSAGSGNGGDLEGVWRCNDLRNNAVPVPLNYVAEELPTAMGGTPVEGLYHLTQWDLFIGTRGISGDVWSRQETIAITRVGAGSADVETMFGQPEGEMGILYQWNETMTFDGNSFASKLTCRTDSIAASDSSGVYSVTDEQLVFITEGSDGTWVRTYTRQ